MPLVSVNIPTYRRDEMLRRAIDSVLAQSVADIEVNVSDNAALPRTREIVEAYGDPRLAYLPNASNLGLHGNITRCLYLGSAPFVTVLTDDDVLYEGSLEKRIDAMERHPTAAIVHGAIDYIDADGRVTVGDVNWSDATGDRFETGAEFIERSMRTANRISISTAMFRREYVAAERLDVRDSGYADMVLWMRIALKGDIAYLHDRLAGVGVHPEADSSREGWYDYDATGQPAAGKMGKDEVRIVRGNKMRFIDESLTDRALQRQCRAATRKHARYQLTQFVASSLGRASRADTLRALVDAAKIEPSLLLTPWPEVLALSAVVGRKPFDWLVARRSC